MKTTLKSSILVAVCSLLAVNIYAQRQHKHFKRVKVDNKKIEAPAPTFMTPGSVEELKPVTTESSIQPEITGTATENVVASTENNTANKVEKASKARVKSQKVHTVKETKGQDNGFFTQKLNIKNKVLDVKDVKKSNLERWVLIMIILFAAGFLFMILALVMAFAVYSGIGALIFWILFALCWTAASVVLVLGLVGVI